MKFASKLSSDNRLQICHVWIVKTLFYIYENWSPHFTNPLPLFYRHCSLCYVGLDQTFIVPPS